MERLIGIGKIAALIGGAAWTVKSLVIMILNDNFQPLEGVLYFLGVGGILVGALGLGAFFASRSRGAMRWGVFVLALALVVVVTSAASSFIQNAVADAYEGGNVGIEEEMGILTPGVIWLVVGIFLVIATRPKEIHEGQSSPAV